jgi:hypothetical protein
MVAVLTLAACPDGERGSGRVAQEQRRLAPFSAVETAGVYKVELVAGAAQQVTLEGDDNLLPLVTTEVRRGALRIGNRLPLRPRAGLTVRLALPRLRSLTVNGASTCSVRGLGGDTFALAVGGAGKVSLAGRVSRLTLGISGAGRVAATGLRARTARVDVSGAASVDIDVTDELEVSLSGAGKVGYRGNPKIKKEISGVGKLIRL